MISLTLPRRTDLTLELRIVLQLHRIDLQRVVALLIAANHRVPLEPGQPSVRAQPEIVARPLQHALLVHHPARQRHARANLGDLVLRLHGQVLLDVSVVRQRLQPAGAGGDDAPDDADDGQPDQRRHDAVGAAAVDVRWRTVCAAAAWRRWLICIEGGLLTVGRSVGRSGLRT